MATKKARKKNAKRGSRKKGLIVVEQAPVFMRIAVAAGDQVRGGFVRGFVYGLDVFGRVWLYVDDIENVRDDSGGWQRLSLDVID